jgi:A/G-specific adenine glycosylase
MTEFPGTPWSADFTPDDALAHAPAAARWRRLPGAVVHVFTHFALRLTVFSARADARASAPDGARYVADAQLDGEALPSVMRKVLEHARSCER